MMGESMALKTTIRRETRQTKLDRLGGAMAVALAKEAGSSDYKKLKKFKTLWKKYKTKLMRIYGPRGRQAARKAAMKSTSGKKKK